MAVGVFRGRRASRLATPATPVVPLAVALTEADTNMAFEVNDALLDPLRLTRLADEGGVTILGAQTFRQ